MVSAPPQIRQDAVSVALYDGGRFLLVKRMNEPAKDFWAFPGGRVEAGESLLHAAAREVMEETGMVVTGLTPLATLEMGTRYVLHIFVAGAFSGTASAMDDAADCGWFTPEQMPQLPATQSTIDMAALILEQK